MIEPMLILLPYKSEVKHQHDICHSQDDGEKNYFGGFIFPECSRSCLHRPVV